MTSLQIDEASIPDLTGKTALITGGASGIGYSTAIILASHNAHVHILDLAPPTSDLAPMPANITFHAADVLSWVALRTIFASIPHLDMVFANAGVSEETNYFADTFDEAGLLKEPGYGVLGVNVRAVLNVIKLGWSHMRAQGKGGSIVITTSATAYAPEQNLPAYSAAKLALVGLLRSLRSIMIGDDITINAVAPAATITKLLPQDLAAPIIAAGLPISSAHFVGLALAYSAVARQSRKVESYGKDEDALAQEGRWNGRVILTLGDTYTELEEGIADLRPRWFGEKNAELTRLQQVATDFR